MPQAPVVLLSEQQWRGRRAAHERRVDAWTIGWRERRASGAKHPVDDFLFTYYPTRPAVLRRWHPGIGVALAGEDLADLGDGYREAKLAGTPAWLLDPTRFASLVPAALRIAALLTATADRDPQFGCFGLHEWAMVYGQRPDETRHEQWPLRLEPQQVRATVDGLGLRCSHFDAFRFFTAAARPLNPVPLTRELQVEHEQGGCLHANMDLYRHASRISPVVGSDLVADCFALARDIRTLDMRAAPYDLRELGYDPVEVETPSGRSEFAFQQRGFAARAAALRADLLAVVDRFLRTMET